MQWIIDRFKEPSSYAAAGAVVIGIGVITSQSWLIMLGIVGGAVGFILKEKGVIYGISWCKFLLRTRHFRSDTQELLGRHGGQFDLVKPLFYRELPSKN